MVSKAKEAASHGAAYSDTNTCKSARSAGVLAGGFGRRLAASAGVTTETAGWDAKKWPRTSARGASWGFSFLRFLCFFAAIHSFRHRACFQQRVHCGFKFRERAHAGLGCARWTETSSTIQTKKWMERASQFLRPVSRMLNCQALLRCDVYPILRVPRLYSSIRSISSTPVHDTPFRSVTLPNRAHLPLDYGSPLPRFTLFLPKTRLVLSVSAPFPRHSVLAMAGLRLFVSPAPLRRVQPRLLV